MKHFWVSGWAQDVPDFFSYSPRTLRPGKRGGATETNISLVLEKLTINPNICTKIFQKAEAARVSVYADSLRCKPLCSIFRASSYCEDTPPDYAAIPLLLLMMMSLRLLKGRWPNFTLALTPTESFTRLGKPHTDESASYRSYRKLTD